MIICMDHKQCERYEGVENLFGEGCCKDCLVLWAPCQNPCKKAKQHYEELNEKAAQSLGSYDMAKGNTGEVKSGASSGSRNGSRTTIMVQTTASQDKHIVSEMFRESVNRKFAERVQEEIRKSTERAECNT